MGGELSRNLKKNHTCDVVHFGAVGDEIAALEFLLSFESVYKNICQHREGEGHGGLPFKYATAHPNLARVIL